MKIEIKITKWYDRDGLTFEDLARINPPFADDVMGIGQCGFDGEKGYFYASSGYGNMEMYLDFKELFNRYPNLKNKKVNGLKIANGLIVSYHQYIN